MEFCTRSSELDNLGDWFWEKARLASEFEGSSERRQEYVRQEYGLLARSFCRHLSAFILKQEWSRHV